MQNQKSLFFPLPPHNYDTIVNGDLGSPTKTIYHYNISDMSRLQHKYLKWHNEIDLVEDLNDYQEQFKAIYKTTNIVKYRSFQYRLLQRGLVTGVQLAAWKLVENDLCYFCQVERETVIHLLYTCQQANTLWQEVAQYVQNKYNIQMIINPRTVILNRVAENVYHIANFICLVTKQYIYSQRCLKGVLSIHALKTKIRELESIEKYISLKNNTISKHIAKWEAPQLDVSEYIDEYLDNIVVE